MSFAATNLGGSETYDNQTPSGYVPFGHGH